MELENAPADCQAAMRRIEKILETGDYLAEFIAVAPGVVLWGPRISVLGALWRLGKAGATWKKHRALTHSVIDEITRNRVLTIIDAQIILHTTQAELHQHWRRMRDAY